MRCMRPLAREGQLNADSYWQRTMKASANHEVRLQAQFERAARIKPPRQPDEDRRNLGKDASVPMLVGVRLD